MTHKELEEKIGEIISHWNTLHPDYDLVVISLPKNDPMERNRILEGVMVALEREDLPQKGSDCTCINNKEKRKIFSAK
jgi:hypothetical protein